MESNFRKISLTLLLSVIGISFADISSTPLTETFNVGSACSGRILYLILDYGIILGIIMGERTTLSKASSKIESLRTTVPKSIVRFMKLNEGDKLDWD